MMKCLRSVFLLLAVGTYTLLSAQEAGSSRIPIPFSTVISGGVSLGAYEAGYNWAMVKALSEIRSKSARFDPDLSSVAGASAGAINALLTTMYWCQKESVPYQNSVENNLFYETWVNLDMEDLLIRGNDPDNKSTLFSRKALRKKADNIMKQMGKNIYREGCEVPMGFAVTKVTPTVEEFQGIKIKNQNFSVPLTFVVKNGKVVIRNKKMPTDSTEFYISIPNIQKDYKKIIDVLFASSAFPGFFQQVKLRYRYKGKIHSSYFMDGGAFDNIPLQMAAELNPEAKLFIFMDPNHMRKEKPATDEEKQEKPPVGFLTSSAGPLLYSVEIFQQMKLYQAINRHFRGHPDRKLILSSRFHPITANYLEHFAAFLDQNFRIYDYHVGIYDSIYDLAKKLIKEGGYTGVSQVAMMDRIMKRLKIDKNPNALTAYNFFKVREFTHAGKKAKANHRYAAIYHAFNRELSDAKRYTSEEFKTFLSKLDRRVLPEKKGSFLDAALQDVDHWARRPIRHIVDRITTLENERAKAYPDYAPIAKALSIGAWAGGGLLKKKDGWDILPMNAPIDEGNEKFRNLLRFIPTEFSTNSINGGFSFAYEAYLYQEMKPFDGLDFKASYNYNHSGSDFIRVDADVFTQYNDFVKLGAGLSGFWNTQDSPGDNDGTYGANAYVDFMDIMRLTYVRRHGSEEDSNYLHIGIENIPSLIYWLKR